MKTYKLHLLRHGITEGNLKGLYIGHTDLPLCQQGIDDINKLQKEFDYPAAQFVFSSPLKRCLQTSALIYPKIKPIIIPELTEYNFGEFEGRGAEELHKKQPLFDRWLQGEPDVRPPFGESGRDFSVRVCSCFEKIVDGILKTETDNACIITHGGVIATILSAFALPEAKAHEWQTLPGCGYTLRVTPSIWMGGRKLEAIQQIPYVKNKTTYYDGWDYYPNEI